MKTKTLNIFKKLAALCLGLTMTFGAISGISNKVLEADAKAVESTYTFTSKAWADSTNSWSSDKDAYQYSNPNVQITSAYSGAGATSKSSFSNITSISISACTTSKGVGNITVKVGDGSAQQICSLSKSSTAKYYELIYSTAVSGKVTFVVNCSTNSMYVQSIKIAYDDGDDEKALTSLTVSGTPTKTTYNAGEAFDPTGLTVTGTYDDNSTGAITSGIEWTLDPEKLSAGDTFCDVMASVGQIVSDVYTVKGLTVTKPITKYTVKYDLKYAGAASIDDSIVNEEESVELPTPTREFYTFNGWFDNEGLTGNALASPYTPTNNITLYAKWTLTKELPAHTGTLEDPFTVEDARYIAIVNETTGKTYSDDVYVKGYIISKGTFNDTYKNIDLNIGDTKGSSTTFKLYRYQSDTTTKFSEDCFSVGDLVYAKAKTIKNYNSTTPELDTAKFVGVPKTITASNISASAGAGSISVLTSKMNISLKSYLNRDVTSGLDGYTLSSSNNDVISFSNSTYIISGKVGDTATITITSDANSEVTKSVAFTVSAPAAPALSNVNVELGANAVTTQFVGNTFDATGITITPTYSPAKTVADTNTLQNVEWNVLVAGKKPSGVYKNPDDENDTFAFEVDGITVKEDSVSAVTVSGDMTKKSYYSNEEWDFSGLSITATYESGKTTNPTTGIAWSVVDDVTVADAFTNNYSKISVKATYAGITSSAYEITNLQISAEITYSNVKVAKFGSAASSSVGNSSYSGDGGISSSTTNGFKVNTTNASNYNNGWDYIKCGGKGTANLVSTITTDSSISYRIDRVVLKIGSVTNSHIKSSKLYVSSSSSFNTTDVQEIDFNISEADSDIIIPITNPVENAYYKIAFNITNSSTSNGSIAIKEVDYQIVSTDWNAVSSISVESSNLTVYKNQEETINVLFNPANASEKGLIWTSSDDSVVKVENGIISGVSEGTATIKAVSIDNNEASVSINVTVENLVNPVTSFICSKTMIMSKGSTEDYSFDTVTEYTQYSTTDTLTYSSSNENVAVISEEGVITAKQSGTTTITVSNGTVSGTTLVIVNNVPEYEGWEIVKNINDLKEGMSIIISSKSADQAMSSFNSSNGRISKASISRTDDKKYATINKDVHIFEVGVINGIEGETAYTHFTLKDKSTNEYITAVSNDDNKVGYAEKATKESEFELNMQQGECNFKSCGDYAKNVLCYNSNGVGFFSMYSSSQGNLNIYAHTDIASDNAVEICSKNEYKNWNEENPLIIDKVSSTVTFGSNTEKTYNEVDYSAPVITGKQTEDKSENSVTVLADFGKTITDVDWDTFMVYGDDEPTFEYTLNRGAKWSALNSSSITKRSTTTNKLPNGTNGLRMVVAENTAVAVRNVSVSTGEYEELSLNNEVGFLSYDYTKNNDTYTINSINNMKIRFYVSMGTARFTGKYEGQSYTYGFLCKEGTFEFGNILGANAASYKTDNECFGGSTTSLVKTSNSYGLGYNKSVTNVDQVYSAIFYVADAEGNIVEVSEISTTSFYEQAVAAIASGTYSDDQLAALNYITTKLHVEA